MPESFFPRVDVLCALLGIKHKDLLSNNTLKISAPRLRALISMAVAEMRFNESGYVRANPDVKGALDDNLIKSAQGHFMTSGYFENRPGYMVVDTNYYLSKYPGVKRAI